MVSDTQPSGTRRTGSEAETLLGIATPDKHSREIKVVFNLFMISIYDSGVGENQRPIVNISVALHAGTGKEDGMSSKWNPTILRFSRATKNERYLCISYIR